MHLERAHEPTPHVDGLINSTNQPVKKADERANNLTKNIS